MHWGGVPLHVDCQLNVNWYVKLSLRYLNISHWRLGMWFYKIMKLNFCLIEFLYIFRYLNEIWGQSGENNCNVTNSKVKQLVKDESNKIKCIHATFLLKTNEIRSFAIKINWDTVFCHQSSHIWWQKTVSFSSKSCHCCQIAASK